MLYIHHSVIRQKMLIKNTDTESSKCMDISPLLYKLFSSAKVSIEHFKDSLSTLLNVYIYIYI